MSLLGRGWVARRMAVNTRALRLPEVGDPAIARSSNLRAENIGCLIHGNYGRGHVV